jgi:hypothetical protein
MRIGRRPLFFAALAVICLVMLEPTPAEYRWVNLFAAGLALFWAVMLLLEERSLVRWSPGAKDAAEKRARRPSAAGPPPVPPREPPL